MKVLAEIMDAHREQDILTRVNEFFGKGADIVDLGFGFDATSGDVERVFRELEDVSGPLAAATQDPELITAALRRADLILSLTEENIPLVGKLIADHGSGAVVIPGRLSLDENIRLAENAGISCIIAFCRAQMSPVNRIKGSAKQTNFCFFLAITLQWSSRTTVVKRSKDQ